MLLAWSLNYTFNFSPYKCFIWSNWNNMFKNRLEYYQHWFNNNIILVNQLFNDNGLLMSYSEFLNIFGILIT